MSDFANDLRIQSRCGNVLASYGPRNRTGPNFAEVEPAHTSRAFFWGVYRHQADGTASWVADAHDEESALHLTDLVSRSWDSLTTAYLAIGAVRYWDEHQTRPKTEGELAGINEILAYMPDIEVAITGRDEELTGVFAYEVAEPFGAWAAEQLVTRTALDPRDVVEKIHALITEATR